MRKVLLLLAVAIIMGALQTTPQAHTTDSKPSQSANEELIDQFWKRSDKAFHEGDYPLAISFHKAIVILDPHDVESYSNAAWLMWSLGNGNEAQQHIKRGLKANPRNWEMWDAAGQQDTLQKYFSKATAAFGNAVTFIPADVDSQLLRRRWAHAAEKSGNTKKSVEIWRDLVKDYPNEAVNQNNLNRLLHPKTTAAPNSQLKEAAWWPVKVLLASLGF